MATMMRWRRLCPPSGVSLLERLMRDNTLYQSNPDTGHFDRRYVTKLLRNYRYVYHIHPLHPPTFILLAASSSVNLRRTSLRSHAAILKVPNELFYVNELQVCADQMDREAYCNWEGLPKKVCDEMKLSSCR